MTKGFRPLQLDIEEVYQFTDLEEDEPAERQHTHPTLSTSGLGSLPCSPIKLHGQEVHDGPDQGEAGFSGAELELQKTTEDEALSSGEGAS